MEAHLRPFLEDRSLISGHSGERRPMMPFMCLAVLTGLGRFPRLDPKSLYDNSGGHLDFPEFLKGYAKLPTKMISAPWLLWTFASSPAAF